MQGDEGSLGQCLASNEDRTGVDVISVPGQHWRTCIFVHSKGPSSEPQTLWFYFFTVATILWFLLTCFLILLLAVGFYFNDSDCDLFGLFGKGLSLWRTPINKQSNKSCFLSFCMFQDSVPAGSYNDPFLSSVIPMVTPTWCHRANWGNPSWGQCRLTWIPNSHILI